MQVAILLFHSRIQAVYIYIYIYIYIYALEYYRYYTRIVRTTRLIGRKKKRSSFITAVISSVYENSALRVKYALAHTAPIPIANIIEES